jgi:hypothetical protein
MKELKSIIATCRKFRQVVVVRKNRTTTNISQCLTNPVVRKFRTTQKIVYAVRTQLRYIDQILNLSNSIGLENKLTIFNTLNHG